MNQSASEQLQTDIPASISAMVLLNSACQGVVETYIDQGNAEHWYAQVEQNLNAVQKLVRQWRLSGNLYFQMTLWTVFFPLRIHSKILMFKF